jgi:phthalate 4,5-dioxygenase
MLRAEDNKFLTEAGPEIGHGRAVAPLLDSRRTREHLGPTDLGIMHFRKVVMDLDRALQRGDAQPQAAHQDRHAVRSGACVTSKSKELPAVMLERFGDAAGLVGRPRIAAAE